MKLLTSNEDKAKREKIIIASNKSSRSSFSPQFSTRVFGISSIIAIAGSTDHTRFYFEADATAVTPIPASASFPQLVTECLNENNDGECPLWSLGNNSAGIANNHGSMPDWDTSLVTNMRSAFNAKTFFNGNISSWNTSSVKNMNSMFYFAAQFNGNISSWNTSSVKDMNSMFSYTLFNKPIGNWNTSAVTDMGDMFSQATAFDQDISTWTGTAATAEQNNMLSGAAAFHAKFVCQTPSNGPASTCKVPSPSPPPSPPPSILPSSSSSRSPLYTKAVALVGFISTIAPMLWF